MSTSWGTAVLYWLMGRFHDKHLYTTSTGRQYLTITKRRLKTSLSGPLRTIGKTFGEPMDFR